MRLQLLLAFFLISATLKAQGVDYNRLDSEQQAVAADGISDLCPANQQWFSATCSKHPDGSFDPIWAKRMLLNKFTIQDIQQYGDLFTVMMAYQRMVNKGLKGKPAKEETPLVSGEEVKPEPKTTPTKGRKKDTDRSTKEDRALAVHDATLKLQTQLVEMKKCAKF